MLWFFCLTKKWNAKDQIYKSRSLRIRNINLYTFKLQTRDKIKREVYFLDCFRSRIVYIRCSSLNFRSHKLLEYENCDVLWFFSRKLILYWWKLFEKSIWLLCFKKVSKMETGNQPVVIHAVRRTSSIKRLLKLPWTAGQTSGMFKNWS